MLTDIFTSPGASLLILIVQGLFAWALWSLRRAFVRNDDYLLHLQRESRRESATARRLSALEEHLRRCPQAMTWPVCTANWRPCAGKSRPSTRAFPAWTACWNAWNTAWTARKTASVCCPAHTAP